MLSIGNVSTTNIQDYVQGDFLDLSGQEIQDRDIPNLVKFLGENLHIKKIKLLGNNIGDQGAIQLVIVSSIEEIDLTENKVTHVGIQGLANSTTVKKLKLNNNPIGDEGIQLLAHNESILELEVSGCGISGKGISEVFKVNRTLKKLNASNNPIKDEGLQTLKQNESIETLELFDCLIGTQGAIYISENHSLKTLNLGHNGIEKKGVQALCRLSLTILNLSENNLNDDSIISLQETNELAALILSGNRITAVGLSLLLKNEKVQTINVYDNPIYLTTLDDIKNSVFETTDNKFFTRSKRPQPKNDDSLVQQEGGVSLVFSHQKTGILKTQQNTISPEMIAAAIIKNPAYAAFFANADPDQVVSCCNVIQQLSKKQKMSIDVNDKK